MKNNPTDNLDRLAQDWAAHKSPSADDTAALGDRICRTLAEMQFLELDEIPIPPTGRVRWDRLGWFVIGAAAALVLTVPFWWPAPPSGSVLSHRDADDHPEAGISAAELTRDQLASMAALFAEMQHTFSGDLAWLAEADGKVCVGLDGTSRSEQTRAAPVAVRIVVVGRKTGESTWARVWTMDVTTRSERVVELTPDTIPGTKLVLWTYAGLDDLILVDSSMVLDGPVRVSSSASEVQRPGVPSRVLSLQTAGMEYRVLQTVSVLPGDAG